MAQSIQDSKEQTVKDSILQRCDQLRLDETIKTAISTATDEFFKILSNIKKKQDEILRLEIRAARKLNIVYQGLSVGTVTYYNFVDKPLKDNKLVSQYMLRKLKHYIDLGFVYNDCKEWRDSELSGARSREANSKLTNQDLSLKDKYKQLKIIANSLQQQKQTWKQEKIKFTKRINELTEQLNNMNNNNNDIDDTGDNNNNNDIDDPNNQTPPRTGGVEPSTRPGDPLGMHRLEEKEENNSKHKPRINNESESGVNSNTIDNNTNPLNSPSKSPSNSNSQSNSDSSMVINNIQQLDFELSIYVKESNTTDIKLLKMQFLAKFIITNKDLIDSIDDKLPKLLKKKNKKENEKGLFLYILK